MEAAHITWRPLGQLFVERGLITQEELETALLEQRETSKRLGTILVSRGLVSGPELTSVLVDQLGMELTKESGFGSGLWDEIRRRHPRGRDRVEPETATSTDFLDEQPSPQPEAEALPSLVSVQEAQPPSDARTPDPARLEADLAKERVALAVAVAEERAELEEALTEERGSLVAALEEERTARQQALQELVQARAEGSNRATELEERMASLEATLAREQTARRAAHDELVSARAETSSRTAELSSLSHQIEELRTQLERSAGAVTSEQEAREKTKQLEARLSALEASLADEQAGHRQAVEELDYARSEASIEASQLRSSVDRIRAELEQLDAATSWFEYWSGATSPAGRREEQAEAE